jgi:hypothetical protein
MSAKTKENDEEEKPKSMLEWSENNLIRAAG